MTNDGHITIKTIQSVLWMGPKAFKVTSTGDQLLELEQEQRSARSRAADDWRFLIEPGASGKGTIGTESTGEAFIVELAGTMLPCGQPALELSDRFSEREIEEIHDAVKSMGRDAWYWPLRARRKDARHGASKAAARRPSRGRPISTSPISSPSAPRKLM